MSNLAAEQSLHFAPLRDAYASGTASPAEVIDLVFSRIEERSVPGIWISLRERAEVLRDAEAVVRRRALGETLPLFGLPFAVKDNIDVAGMPTTVACPDFSYLPAASAPVVTRLLQAGALLIGKTNLDQFATGLSAYGPLTESRPIPSMGATSAGARAPDRRRPSPAAR